MNKLGDNAEAETKKVYRKQPVKRMREKKRVEKRRREKKGFGEEKRKKREERAG